MHTPVRFGLALPAGPNPGMTGPDYTAGLQQRIAILSGHIDSLWFVDYLQLDEQPVLEGWTALTYWAALQPQLSIGHIVLCQSFRNPALLAKMAATLHYLTGGRFMLGLGAGWKEDEYRSYGYDFPSPRTRLAELRRLNTGKDTAESSLVGTPHQVIEQVHSFMDLGVDYFELALPFEHPMSKHCYELLAHEVLPAFHHQPTSQ